MTQRLQQNWQTWSLPSWMLELPQFCQINCLTGCPSTGSFKQSLVGEAVKKDTFKLDLCKHSYSLQWGLAYNWSRLTEDWNTVRERRGWGGKAISQVGFRCESQQRATAYNNTELIRTTIFTCTNTLVFIPFTCRLIYKVKILPSKTECSFKTPDQD